MSDERPVDYPLTPELDKRQEILEVSQEIGAFIDWLFTEQDVRWYKVNDKDQLIPFCESIEEILAHYFNIDLNKIEQERRAILEWIHDKHKDKPAPGITLSVEGEEV